MKFVTLEEGDKRSCILIAQISQRKIRGHSKSILSSVLGIESAFFAVESSLEYINAHDVITFCLYLMNKMLLNRFKGLKIAHDLISGPVYIEVEDPR